MTGPSGAGEEARHRLRGRRGNDEDSPRAEEMKQAALALFARRDFASVTIKDIAAAVGVNTALIYYYFDSKEDLFRATIAYAVERALARYRGLAGLHDDPAALIAGWLRTNAELSEPIRQLVKIMLDYAGSTARMDSIDALVRRFYDEERRILSDAVRRGVAEGRFRPVDADALADFVSIHLDGVMVASAIRTGFDMEAAMAGLEAVLWRELGTVSQG